MIRQLNRSLLTAAITLATATHAWAQAPNISAKPAKPTFYIQTNLVSSTKSLKEKVHDKDLLNPWGLVQGPTPFWISDNNAGASPLYDGKGKIFSVANGKKQVPF